MLLKVLKYCLKIIRHYFVFCIFIQLITVYEFQIGFITIGVDAESTVDPNFGEPISNVTVAVGREAILTCSIYDLNSYKVAWLRVDTQTILTIQHHIITKNHRIGMSSIENRIWQLRIRNVRKEDRGWYMCQLNTDPMKSQTGYLNVVAPPDIIDYQTSHDIVVQEGETVNLTCSAAGSPEPTIKWRKEKHRSLLSIENKETSTLVLKETNRRHTGAYLCIASNGIPPSVSKRIMVIVNFPPVIWCKHEIIFAVLGQRISLECLSESHPKSINYWTYDTKMLEDGIYETINIDNVYKVKMSLIVHFRNKSDFGVYRCVGKNSLGMAEKIIHVYQKMKFMDITANKVGSHIGGSSGYGVDDWSSDASKKFVKFKSNFIIIWTLLIQLNCIRF